MYYETDKLNEKQVNSFKLFLDSQIGTDYEVSNYDDDDYFYIFIYDLIPSEVIQIREYEKSLYEK